MSEAKESLSSKPRLKAKYDEVIAAKLTEQFGYPNLMAVPRMTKIVVSMGLSEARENPDVVDHAATQLGIITGQKPAVRKAKKSVAAFRVRQGMSIGAVVTMRGPRMWEFFDRLLTVALPRIRDFRGLESNSFDGRGNYSFGLREQTIFPEIDFDRIDQVRGMNITVVTTAKTDEEARALLLELGMPLQKGS